MYRILFVYVKNIQICSAFPQNNHYDFRTQDSKIPQVQIFAKKSVVDILHKCRDFLLAKTYGGHGPADPVLATGLDTNVLHLNCLNLYTCFFDIFIISSLQDLQLK